MLALAIVIGYFVIGSLFARSSFNRALGNAKRTYKPSYSDTAYWTPEFTNAFWLAITNFLVWPTVAPFQFFIMGPTPHEQRLENEKKEKELATRFKELERDVLRFGERI